MENFDHKVLDKLSMNFIKVLLNNDAISAEQYADLSDMHFYDRIMAINREKDFHIDFDQLFSTEKIGRYSAPSLKKFDDKLYVELSYVSISEDSEVKYIRIRRQNIFGFWDFKRISEKEFIANAKDSDGNPAEIEEEGSAYFSADFVNTIVIIDDKRDEALWKENPLYLPSHKGYEVIFSITESREMEFRADIQAKDMAEAKEISSRLKEDIEGLFFDNFPLNLSDLNHLVVPVYSQGNEHTDFDVTIADVSKKF